MRLPRVLAVPVLASLLVAVLASPAGAWTWSSATHPAGSVNIGGSASGGGLWLYHGTYFLPGVGHVDSPLGQGMNETPNTAAGDPAGSGFLGHVAYSNWTGSLSEPDLGLVAAGTDPIPARVAVSQGWLNAPIVSYSTGNDLPQGAWVCESGFSWYSEHAGGYRCGQISSTCDRSVSVCYAFNANGLAAAGDSGGLVWWYSGSGVEILGWSSVGAGATAPDGSYTGLGFVPPWALAHYQWTQAQSWQGGGGVAPFPAGNDGTGCFVTISGCQAD